MNQRLESVEKEMSQNNASSVPGLCEQDDEQQSHSVESKRLVSEDHSHYILIKGEVVKVKSSSNQILRLRLFFLPNVILLSN